MPPGKAGGLSSGAKRGSSTFIPLRRTSQCNQHPGCATLYLDSSAASEDLFDTARRRLESAIGTLSVFDPCGNALEFKSFRDMGQLFAK